MESVKNRKSIVTTLLMIGFLLASNATIYAQDANKELKDFKITIKKSNDEIIMKCEEGCAWLDLSYNKKKKAQAISETGMTKVKKKESAKGEISAKFLFTITETDDGIELKGLKGTAWTDLSFSLGNNQKQMIDQFGMANGK